MEGLGVTIVVVVVVTRVVISNIHLKRPRACCLLSGIPVSVKNDGADGAVVQLPGLVLFRTDKERRKILREEKESLVRSRLLQKLMLPFAGEIVNFLASAAAGELGIGRDRPTETVTPKGQRTVAQLSFASLSHSGWSSPPVTFPFLDSCL